MARMARLIERIFDPRRPLIARRFFVAAGRHYNPGDAFDWRRMAVDQRRVKLLFDAGKLMHPDTDAAPEAEPLIEVAAVGAVPAPTIAQEVEDEDAHHIAITASATDERATSAEQVSDDLDGLNMNQLRTIALAENAPSRVSRAEQREAIRENRRASAAG
jgi:hypothetical protein